MYSSSKGIATVGATGTVAPEQKNCFKTHIIETRSFEVYIKQIIIVI